MSTEEPITSSPGFEETAVETESKSPRDAASIDTHPQSEKEVQTLYSDSESGEEEAEVEVDDEDWRLRSLHPPEGRPNIPIAGTGLKVKSVPKGIKVKK